MRSLTLQPAKTGYTANDEAISLLPSRPGSMNRLDDGHAAVHSPHDAIASFPQRLTSVSCVMTILNEQRRAER
jgi:hypothetical protein